MANPDPQSTFRILVTSDIHLGFSESDPIRGNDSFISFEEILSIAKEKNVDFILHGGDLFHDNKPSRNTLHTCLALLREYCMGDKPVQFEYLSDQSADYQHCKFPSVNYEDPNYNIGIPMFSIHGNHDDPTGPGHLCSLDLLHTAGLVNYFGKYLSLDKIQVSPVLLQKGNTRLALYGLGSIRDERLHRLFVGQNVTMLRPKEHQDSWFNMFVLHQNRSKHSATNYIPEQFLEDFLDLVIWGHEHECKLNVSEEAVEWNAIQQFYVCQPGSSVATSLSEGEKVAKYVGLLEINGKDFRMQPIRLKSVRQFYMEDMVLSKYVSPDLKLEEALKRTEALCTEKVEALISKAEEEHSGSPKQPTQPLIRLRVDYTGFTPFSAQRFAKKFVDRVANPKQIIHFVRRRTQAPGQVGTVSLMTDTLPMVLDSTRVEDMVQSHFRAAQGDNRLELLTEKGMGMAVKEFVEKEEREAIKEIVHYQLSLTQDHLMQRDTQEDSIAAELLSFKERKHRSAEDENDAKEAMKRAKSLRESQGLGAGFSDEEDNSSDEDVPVPAKGPRGRGRGRGSRGGSTRGGRGSSTRGRGRGKKEVVVKEEDNNSMDADETFSNSTSRKSGRSSQATKPNSSRQKTLVQMMASTSKNRIHDSDEDAIILDDSDSDTMQSQPRAIKKSSTPASRNRRGGIQYTEVSSEEEDFSFRAKPATKRRR